MTEGGCLNKTAGFLHGLPKCLFQLGAGCVHLTGLQACGICVFVVPLQSVYLAYEAAFLKCIFVSNVYFNLRFVQQWL